MPNNWQRDKILMTTTEAPQSGTKKSHFNKMNIPCCIERAYDKHGNYVATGNFAPGFDWIKDDGVIAAEHIHGTNVRIYVVKGNVEKVFTRRNDVTNPYGNKEIFFSIEESQRRGLLHRNGEECGTIPFTPAKLRADMIFDYPYWISRDYQKRRMSFDQWGKLPKTVENISNWLKEDLASQLKNDLDHFVDCGAPTHNTNGIARPYGIVFFHPDGRVARVTCNMFSWFYEEFPRTKGKKRRSKITKDEWENMSEDEKAKVRQLKKDRIAKRDSEHQDFKRAIAELQNAVR